MLVCAIFVLPADAGAAVQTTTIKDDHLAAGAQIAQYPASNPEIQFVSPSEYGFAHGDQPRDGTVALEACGGPLTVESVSSTSSPPNAEQLAACGSLEFPYRGSFAVLTDTAERVAAYVGDPTEAGARFELDAYDVEGRLLKSATVSAPEAAITTPIEVETPGEYAIAFVALYNVSGGTDHYTIGMDDFSVTYGEGERSISLASSVGSTQLAQSASVRYHVSIVRHNEANGNVTFKASGLPPGVHASFSPNPLGGAATSGELTLTVENGAPVGAATGTIHAEPETSAVATNSSHLPISVQVVAPFGVYLGEGERAEQPSVASVALPPCSSVAVPVSTLLGPGFTGTPVELAVHRSGGEAGIASASLPSTVLANPGDFGLEGADEQALVVSSNATAETNPFYMEITPTSGPFTEPTAKLEVTKAPPQIYPLGQSILDAPQLHRPGTQLTIHGVGFCPDSKVTFGNSQATVTPSFISADGTEIRATAPALATSGPVTVESAGRTAKSEPITIDSYRDWSGFSWHNKDYGMRLSQQMTEELFGEEETHEEFFGVKWRKPNAGLYEDITNKHIPGGLCFGMAFTSLELRDYPDEIGELPRAGAYNAWGLTGPSAPSEALLKLVIENFSLQFTDQLIPSEVNTVIGIHGTDDDIEAIEAGLNEGQPVILGMIHWSGLSIAGHTILAYDTQPQPGGKEVRVYNPNIPFTTGEATNAGEHEQAELKNSQLNLDNGRWTFPQFPWEGSEADLVVYKHSSLPIINGELPHLPNIFTAAGMVAFGDAGDGVTQLSDSHGALFSGGQLAPQSSWPKGVAPMPAFTGTPSPLQLMTLDPKQAGTLTATIDRGAGGGGMNLLLPGLQASLQAGAHAGQTDHVTIDPHTDAIGYATSATHTTLSGTLLSAPPSATGGSADASPGTASAAAITGAANVHHKQPSALPDHLAQFSLDGGGSGAHEQISFADGRSFILAHSGPPATLSLTLQGFAGGVPTAVQLPPQPVAGGATVSVEPQRGWGTLGSGVVQITTTIHGHRRVRRVRGHRLGSRFAGARRTKLTALGGGHYRLSVTLGLHRVPKHATLSIGATIVRHGRMVMKAKPVSLQGGALKAGKASLTLPKTLGGRYTVKLRLLEITLSGAAVQGSTTVTRTFTVSA